MINFNDINSNVDYSIENDDDTYWEFSDVEYEFYCDYYYDCDDYYDYDEIADDDLTDDEYVSSDEEQDNY